MGKMSSVFPFVINLVNTAFGVTVLAVPYCFHQCGLILGSLLLVASSHASKKSCSLLLRSAQISRKRDFESLGFHVGGFLGKFIVEMSLIGYLVGTAIAWFVIIGDVSPAVVSSLIGIENTWGVRAFLIVAIGVGIVLPLSLVKDITSLSSASNVAIGIYTIFVLQLFFSTLPRILSGDWVNEVNFWKPDGVLQCLPIFGISFLCQTVVFVLYEALPDPSVKKMEHIVNTAMDIVLLLSFTVGFSGYVMYFDDGVEGDLLNNYKHDFISEFIRLGFCISTILSFPLLVFPCRASINSLISSTQMNSIDATPAGGTYIPHDRFFMITSSVIVGTLICGVLFPNVEFVMALVGATMGAMLTFIIPSYIFLKVSGEDTSKTEAKVLLVLGLCLFCLSTFSVLSISESQTKVVEMAPIVQPVLNPPTTKPNDTLVKPTMGLKKVEELLNKIKKSNNSVVEGRERLREEEVKRSIDDKNRILVPLKNTAKVVKESRKEPVLPQEGMDRQLRGEDHQPAKEDPRLQQPDTKLNSVGDAGLKRQPEDESLKRQVEDAGLKRQVEDAGLEHHGATVRLNPVEDQKTGRLPNQGDMKPREDIVKQENKNVESKEVKDEVRIGERKILNNGAEALSKHLVEDIISEDNVKSVTNAVKHTKPEGNITLADQQHLIKLLSNDITPNIRNKTTGVQQLQKETKPSIKDEITATNGSNVRKESVKTIRRIRPPLHLRKHLESRIKLIKRNRRNKLSDDREV